MGEIEIITYLAKGFIEEGYDTNKALDKAMNVFDEALKEAYEYECNKVELTYKQKKEKIFLENKSMVDAIVYKKYRTPYLKNFQDDMKQEGYMCLWRIIDKDRFFKENGEIDLKYMYNTLWGWIGSFIRRKVFLDERCKKNKNVEIFSLNFVVGKDEDNQVIELIENDFDLEKYVIEKIELENLKKFASDIDKGFRNRNIKYADVVREALNDLSQFEIGQKLGTSQVTVSRRMREVLSMYREANLNREAC